MGFWFKIDFKSLIHNLFGFWLCPFWQSWRSQNSEQLLFLHQTLEIFLSCSKLGFSAVLVEKNKKKNVFSCLMGLAPCFWPAHASQPSPVSAPALSPVPDRGRTLPPHRRRCTAPPYRVCCQWPPPCPRLAKTGSRARSAPTSSHFHSPHPGLLPLQRIAAAAQRRPVIGAIVAPLAPSPHKRGHGLRLATTHPLQPIFGKVRGHNGWLPFGGCSPELRSAWTSSFAAFLFSLLRTPASPHSRGALALPLPPCRTLGRCDR
jgi:hypothetical protein